MQIRVLHLIKGLGRGGAETLLVETNRFHDKDTFAFDYGYFLPWKDSLVKPLEDEGNRVVCFRSKNVAGMLLQVFRIVRFVRENNIKIIHGHLPWSGIVGRIVGRIAKVKVVYTEHNKLERYHAATRIGNVLTMNWQECVIGVSSDVTESVVRHKKKLVPTVKTIVNGVDVNRFRPNAFPKEEARRELGIPDDALVVLTIAVFRVQKRLDVWIRTAKAISDANEKVHFVIVGQGPLESDLRQLVAALKITDKVHFTGQKTEVRPYLAACDIYFMSSIFEGLPIALLEAMASGCAVVSTDAGGIKELIEHEKSGLLCSVDRPELLEGLLLDLLENSERRNELGKSARQRVIESFSMKKMVDELEKCYGECLGLEQHENIAGF